MKKENKNIWLGIRTIYLFGQKKDGTNLFEERVVVFSGADKKEAFKKAEIESDEYASSLGLECYPEMISYEQDGDPLIDGYEVWSEVYEAKMSLEEFYTSRYDAFKYKPDE